MEYMNMNNDTLIVPGVRRFAPGIVQDEGISHGRPVLEGRRLFVDLLLDNLECGMTESELCDEFDLTPEQVHAITRLTPEQVQYIRGYADGLAHLPIQTELHSMN